MLLPKLLTAQARWLNIPNLSQPEVLTFLRSHPVLDMDLVHNHRICTSLCLLRSLVALRVVVPPLVLQLGQLPVLLQLQHGVVQHVEETRALRGGHAVAFGVQVLTNLHKMPNMAKGR